LAEQTHSSSGTSASYTLVSVAASADKRKIPSGSGGNNRGDRLRKSRTEKGGPQCTKLSALDDYDTLLLPDDEESPQRKAAPLSPCLKGPFRHGQKASSSRAKTIITGPAASNVPPEAAVPAVERPQSKGSQKKMRSPVPDVPGDPSSKSPRLNALKAPSPGRSRPHSQGNPRATSSASNMSGCSERLYVAQKPWVAGVSDTDLLQYLALRGGSPEIASPPRTADTSFHATSMSSQSRSCRRQYRNHRDLFDSCLHRDASPSPPPRQNSAERSRFSKEASRMTEQSSTRSGSRPIYSPQRQVHSARGEDRSRLIDQIEDINVIAPSVLGDSLDFIPSSPSKADVHAYSDLLASIEKRYGQDQQKKSTKEQEDLTKSTKP